MYTTAEAIVRLLRELGLWSAGIALQVTILARGRAVRLWRKYPLFYAQLACGVFVTLLDQWAFPTNAKWLSGFYWDVEFLAAVVGCGVLVDILRQAFVHSAPALVFGKATMGFLYGAIGLFTISFALDQYWHAPVLHLVLVERDFRLVQTAVLLSVVAAVFYFGLPLGRNLNGMLVGYGTFIACDLVTLALDSYYPKFFAQARSFLHPVLYCSSLLIYLYALWTYTPALPPKLLSAGGDLHNQPLEAFGLGSDATPD